MTMGVVDTMMVGHLSPTALAAVALGNVYYFGVSIFGLGVLMGLDPIIAHAVGAGDAREVARGVQRGLLLATLLCIPTTLAILPVSWFLRITGQPAEVAPIATAYAVVNIPGTLGMFTFTVLRQSLQAMGRMRPIVVTIVVTNLLNVGLNWVLIYGKLGLPALGAVGSAWATTTCRLVMALLLAWLAWPVLRRQVLPLERESRALGPLRRLFLIGAPIGVQHQLEYGVFGVVGLLMGVMGTVPVAGHQVAINLASITFMVPLGLSSAAAVAVGHAVGRRDQTGATEAAKAALLLAVGFMGATAATFLGLPGPLARLYTESADVLAIALVLLPIAGVFQVFDGIQVTSIGILRGLGDTRTPMITGILGFWLLGLPVSLFLAFPRGLGPAGLWWGLVLALMAVAVILLHRVRAKLRQPLRRLSLEFTGEHALPPP